jgi:hypothetical protein
MNTSATPSTTARTPGPDAASTPSREGTRHHPARDRFERALQAREQRPSVGEDSEQTTEGESGGTGWACPFQALAPKGPAPSPLPAAAGVIADRSSTQAAIETSLSASPGQVVAPMSAANPAAAWEVSVRDSLAPALQVRAERLATPDAQRGWSLTIGSPAANVDLLTRHTPRLNERLRKHGIELSHVRVDEADREEQ